MGAVIHVLEHLGRHWWGRRPVRRTERRGSLSRIGVVHGFNEIIAQFSLDDASGQIHPPAEMWGVENESDDGYGAVLPMGRGEWLHVGKVLAVKPADSRVWAVGIVRRLAAQYWNRIAGSRCKTRDAAPEDRRPENLASVAVAITFRR